MSADPAQRRQLGELLVEKGVLTDAQLQVALEEQRRSGAPLGEILVQLGFSIGPTVGNALAEQHGGPLRTEYGFALGVPSAQAAQAKDRGTVAQPKPAEPTPEQDMAIARLTAALNERTQELQRTRTELDALERHEAESAIAAADLELLQRELVEHREERTRGHQALEVAADEHQAELAALNAELVAANGERTEHDDRVGQLEDQLAQARVQRDDPAENQGVQAELRRALELRNAELATASGDLENVQRELVELREQSTRAHQTLELALEEHTSELAAVRTELAEVHGDRAGHDDHVRQLQDYVRQLEDQVAQAHSQHEDRAEIKGAQAELRLALEQRNAELAQLQGERTALAYRAAELERELELASARPSGTVRIRHDPRDLSEGRALHADEQVAQARIEHDVTGAVPREQSALVAAAVARAQRRYGPPIRMTPEEEEAGGGDGELQDTLEAEHRAVDTDVPAANPITIRLWQLALFIVLVPSLLYVLAPLIGMLVAAAVVLLAAVLVIFGQRRLSRSGKRPSRKAADRATATPPIPHQG